MTTDSKPILHGKVAVVTGAGRGLGREHALALAAAGAKLVINDLGSAVSGDGSDAAPAQAVADEIRNRGGEAVVSNHDVADFAQAQEMIAVAIEAFGRLDILVNNAGILRDRMLVNLTEADWDSVINVHLKGHFGPLRHAATHWRERSKAGETVRARVINTSSPSGLIANVGQLNYGAAKAGIAGMTLVAAAELGRYGVTVNAIAPSARTRLTEAAFGEIPVTAGFDPMDPANASPLIVALCADGAQAITGQCFFVYGGHVNALKSWAPGKGFVNDGIWNADALLDQLTADDDVLRGPQLMNEVLEQLAPGSSADSLTTTQEGSSAA
jgi:NAD(P)-dependent dehydrogenase (short-subunit alcohol dehydrogenase family)